MRLLYISFILLCASYAACYGTVLSKTSISKPPVIFVENKGQISDQFFKPRPDVLFSGCMDALLYYYVRNNGVSYQLTKIEKWKLVEDAITKKKRRVADDTKVYRLEMNWCNTNPDVTCMGKNQLNGCDNYYLTACPEGALNVKTFREITFKNIYKNIDLHYYGKDGALKYEYILKANTDYRQIKINVKGATKIRLSKDRSIIITTPLGILEEAAPVVFQNGKELESSWIIKSDTLSFAIKNYDSKFPMLIDPVVRVWGSYFGGPNEDTPNTPSIDQSGNIFLPGYTTSGSNIATTGAHQTVFAGGINSTGDAYLAKFNSAGVRQWTTYYGGYGTDNGYACAPDASGNVYLAGYSNTGYNGNGGTVIATPGTFISTYTTGTTGFLAKFDSMGTRIWGTHCYGNPNSCVVDQNSDVYIAGEFPANFVPSTGTNIATPGCHQSTYYGGQDGFITKFNSSGVRLWGTFYGGGGSEIITSLALDNNNNLYASGSTWSNSGTLIATPGSHQFNFGGFNGDGFLVKFTSAGVRLWGTYYGASDVDKGWSCCTDLYGNVYLAGTQLNNNYPYSGTLIATPGSHQSAIGGGSGDAYLAKFNSAGIRLWATYYGGPGYDEGLSCYADNFGNVYLSGVTTSSLAIASSGCYQAAHGGGTYDAFLVKFNSSGIRQWGTYYGDVGDEYAENCIFNGLGNVYITGPTSSTLGVVMTSPLSNQSIFGGGPNDAFIAKFIECNMPSVPSDITSLTNKMICTGNSTSLDVSGSGNISWFTSPTATAVAGIGSNFITGPLSVGIYTFYAQASMCVDSVNVVRTAVMVTVSPNVPPVITVNTGSICSGQTFTIIPSGAATYTIYGGNSVVTPSYTTPYMISGTSSLGCVSSSFAICTVSVSQSPVITVNSGNRCTGTIYTITPSGAFTYTITGNNFTVTPSVNTSYSVTGTSSTGCAATNTAVVNINVIPSPTTTVTPSGSICAGEIFYINASSGPVTGWGWWSITGGNYNVSPFVTTSYTVIGVAMNGCSDTHVVTVSVNPVPIVTVTNGFTCSGDSYTISPAGATNYSITGNTFVVNPLQNTNYTVTGASQYGCVSQPAVCTISVLVRPTISTSSGTICAGETFTIAPVGGASYTISGGSTIVSPITTATYIVIGTNTSAAVGCQVSSPVISTVFVNPSPTVTANNGTICPGQNFTITPAGASTYTYSAGSAIVNPISNSTYSITGTNQLGCVSPSAALSQIVVIPKPILLVVSSNTSICLGEVAVLTASGGVTYTLYGYSFNPSIAITPSITTQYMVIGTGTNGCIGSQQVTQTVELCTAISENTNTTQRFLIYPNPSSGEFFIETWAEIEIELLNGLGQILRRERLSPGTNIVDLFELAPGVYFIRPEGHYIGMTTKVIKQ